MIEIGADDGDGRSVDDGIERVVGFLNLRRIAPYLFLPPFERGSHLVERNSQRANFVLGSDFATVAEFAGGQRRGILTKFA